MKNIIIAFIFVHVFILSDTFIFSYGSLLLSSVLSFQSEGLPVTFL